LSLSSLAPTEAWQFLFALIGKFSNDRLPLHLKREIKQAATNLTTTNKQTALDFLNQKEIAGQPLSRILIAGIGDGLARTSIDKNTLNLASLQAQTLPKLIAYSRTFTEEIMRHSTNVSYINQINSLVQIYVHATELKRRIRRNLFPLIKDPQQIPLLIVLLDDTDEPGLASAVLKIWRSTRFKIVEFDEIFFRKASKMKCVDILRNTIISLEETSESNRFLSNTLHPQIADLEWLATSSLLSPDRKIKLLLSLLEQSTDAALQQVASDFQIYNSVLKMLLTDIQKSSGQIGRLLLVSERSISRDLEIGLQILPYLDSEISALVAKNLLTKALKDSRENKNRQLEELINLSAKAMEPQTIIALAIPSNASASSIGTHLIALNRTKDSLRKDFLNQIDYITERLIHSNFKNLRQEAMSAWSELIADSLDINKHKCLSAARTALKYSLRYTNYSMSQLIKVSFPIVWTELKKEKPRSTTGPFFFIVDRDPKKIAHDELIYAYMHSKWPPADLLLIALEIDEVQETLHYISQEYNGKKYMRLIESDVSRLPKDKFEILIKEIDLFKNSPADHSEKRF
jgi:hypothetical protein